MKLIKNKILLFLGLATLGGATCVPLINFSTSCKSEGTKVDLSSLSLNSVNFTFYASNPAKVTTYDIEGINHNPNLITVLTNQLRMLCNNDAISFNDFYIANQAYPNQNFTNASQILLSVTAKPDSKHLKGTIVFLGLATATNTAAFDLSLCSADLTSKGLSIICVDHDDPSNVHADHVYSELDTNNEMIYACLESIKSASGRTNINVKSFSISPVTVLKDFNDYRQFHVISMSLNAVPNNVDNLIGTATFNVKFKVSTNERFNISSLYGDENDYAYAIPTYHIQSLTPVDIDDLKLKIKNYVNQKFEDLNLANNPVFDVDYTIEFGTNGLIGMNFEGMQNPYSITCLVSAKNASELLVDSWLLEVDVTAERIPLNLGNINIQSDWGVTALQIEVSVAHYNTVSQEEINLALNNNSLWDKVATIINNDVSYGGDDFTIDQLRYLLKISSNAAPGDKTVFLSSGEYKENVNLVITPQTTQNLITGNSQTITGKCIFKYKETAKDLSALSTLNSSTVETIYVSMPNDVSVVQMSSLLPQNDSFLDHIYTVLKNATSADLTKSDYTLSDFQLDGGSDLSTAKQCSVLVTAQPNSRVIKNSKRMTFQLQAKYNGGNLRVTFRQRLTIGTLFDDKNPLKYTHGSLFMRLEYSIASLDLSFTYDTNTMKTIGFDSGGGSSYDLWSIYSGGAYGRQMLTWNSLFGNGVHWRVYNSVRSIKTQEYDGNMNYNVNGTSAPYEFCAGHRWQYATDNKTIDAWFENFMSSMKIKKVNNAIHGNDVYYQLDKSNETLVCRVKDPKDGETRGTKSLPNVSWEDATYSITNA